MNKKIKLLLTTPTESPDFNKLWSASVPAMAEHYGFEIDLLKSQKERDVAEWNRLCKDYHGIITSWRSPQFDAELLEGNNSLEIIGHAAGSVADLVSDAVYARGIKVVSANDTMARSVAEWCMLTILLGIGKTLDYAAVNGLTSMRWDKCGTAGSVENAVIGIWGFGSITRNLIKYLKPMNPKKIMVCSNFTPEKELNEYGVEAASLEQVFAESDAIVLLAGLNCRNAGRVNAALLESIQNGAALINCGRAGLVNETTLIDELKRNRFRAFFDVYYVEPLPESHPFNLLPNVFMTPHVGGVGNMQKFIPDVLENFNRFFTGKPLRGEITRERAAAMTSHKIAVAGL